MNYTKPTVTILGQALAVINLIPSNNYKTMWVVDGLNVPGHILSVPAYDLDD